MYQVSSEQHRSIISAILRSPVRPPKSMRGLDWRRFLQTYFANVDSKDLADRDPKDLAGAALSHLMFAKQRGRAALVRVFNPTLREHGFVSPHTIIDVVNDDMPFLVDSISLALTERALTLHFLAHPIFAVTRDRAGNLSALQERTEPFEGTKQRLESFQHVEVDRIVDPAALKSLAAQIERSMRDVRVACADWGRMRAAARSAVQDLSSMSARVDAAELSETCALLEWMENRHFTFLGYREYRLKGGKGRERLEAGQVQRARHLAAGAQKNREHDSRAAQRHPQAKPLAQSEPGHEGQFSVHGASGRLSGLCRHQAIRRQGTLDRRAALPGPLDLRRVQRQSARNPLVAPENRAGGGTLCTWRPTATTARRCSTFWNPFRAMNYFKRAFLNSTASSPGYSACRKGRACACCCAAIYFTAFIRAWCSCRARNTTPKSGSESNG